MVSAQDNAHLTGESTSLVCVQLKKWDFEKIFNKSDGDFQQLLCKKTVSEGCARCKKIWLTFQYFDVFLHIQDIFLQTALLAKKKNPFNLEGHFSMILVLGLILVKPAVLAKESNH